MRAVFLDRDGVLNKAIVRNGKPYPPATLDELEILPDAVGACERLKSHGFFLVCVTNQPDIARGTASAATVESFNNVLREQLGLDEMRICPHDDSDGCECRKPRPGLLTQAAREHGVDLAQSFMVGDRWRDIDAGRAAGCRTVFINRGYDERQPEQADFVTESVAAAADWIVATSLVGAEDIHPVPDRAQMRAS